ncbi:MAG: PASTA domain-containing protein [Clostridia bacterium]|nr:PASTA domain-containing protein [Clostridia bacterium]
MSVKPNKQMLTRSIVVMICVVLAMTLVSVGSLFKIMIVNGDKYQSLASEQQLYDNLVSAPRGDIYDRNMKLLATSSTAWTVYITPNNINSLNDDEAKEIRKTISQGLSSVLDMEEDEVYKKTEQKTYYVILKKRIDKDVADAVRKFISDKKGMKMSRYIGLDETTKRHYPNQTLASTVLGFVGDDNQGLAGLESYYDNELTGVSGRVVAAKNAKGTDMPFTYEKVEEAQKGNSIISTIDSYIQYVCEKYLDDAAAEEKVAERGAVVVMNVNNGEILGMAVSGDFNPNEPFALSETDQAIVDGIQDEDEKAKKRTELLNRQWRNKAVSDTYEPGSVFKIFTAAAAIEEGLITSNSSFSCNYTYTVAGNPYHCHKRGGHGVQSLAQSISNSCNPAFIQIGQLLGIELFSKYYKAFGLAEKTGIDLPGEASPYYHIESKMGATELASSSFGQTFNITPLQMISLSAAAVNGGYLVQPHVAQKIIDAEGNVVKTVSCAYKRQVISESTSAQMRTLLEYVVQNGAKNGIVAGYRVGGKTGTSEKVAKMLELDVRGLYIGSYVGIAPIDDPEIAVFVMLDEPTSGRYYGGAISAPVGSKIMADIMPYLGYEPRYSDEELKNISVTVPDVVGSEIMSAREKMSNSKLTYKIVGDGNTVLRQLPEAGASVYSGGTVILYTDSSQELYATVPDFTGLTASQVNALAAYSNVNIEYSGNTSSADFKAYNQSIAAGTTVPIGEVVTVYFRDENNTDLAESSPNE